MLCGSANPMIGSARRQRVPRLLRVLCRDDGVSALEFALIGPAFIALLVALLQVGMVFFLQQVLQTSTTQTARLIMTGQAQTQKLSAAEFVQHVCTNAGSLFNCANLYANVQTFSSFSGITMDNPISNGSFNSAQLSYAMGGPGDIVLVQVFYQLPVLPGPLSLNLSRTGNGDALLVGTSVFRNEPYQ